MGLQVPLPGKRNSWELKTTDETPLPKNRLIRKRFSARTTGIHLSALPAELRAALRQAETSEGDYLEKHQIPDKIRITTGDGGLRVLSRDETWALAERAAIALESSLLRGKAGEVTAFFSDTGQGPYANYGRPVVDYTGFFVDHIHRRLAVTGIGKGAGPLRYGPLFIAIDTAAAAGLTAIGYAARGADLSDRAVVTDVASTGAYEGGSAWASAKVGVLAGAKAMALTAVMPIPGARVASVAVGFFVGATAAIAAKKVVNTAKDVAVDAACKATDHAPDQKAVAGPASPTRAVG